MGIVDRMVHNVASQDGLSGKRVVVTGGTKGIGAGIAARLAGAGASVLVAARSAPERELPANVRFVKADLSTESGVAGLAAEALEILGGVDVIVDNAGGAVPATSGIADLTEEHWHDAYQLNVMAAVRLDRALLPGMLERGSGVIIHISSIAALRAESSLVHYGAAKAALNAYSKSLATEVAPRGVRVNRIAPGLIKTEAVDSFVQHIQDTQGLDQEAALGTLHELVGGIPAGREGKPADIANVVAFLASDQAEWIVGAEFRIDGGSVRQVS
ncbi:SDR family oxidoreductase [Crossiella cryophila]